jgi:EAL domain-containing protein (putative c-di-GMP-specific phosphodiesterase class I)
VAASAPSAPVDSLLFVNLHALDLTSDELYSESAPLASIAGRVVLEVTERASLHRIEDLKPRIRRLRDMGFRIAVDDLGSSYAGLSSFQELGPDMVKLDMSLIRHIEGSASKASLVRSMISVCRNELGIGVVCEGVETERERDTLEHLGGNLLQGYLFARPERGFRAVAIP